MKSNLVSIGEVLRRRASEGVYISTRIGKESYPQIGERGIHPQCSEGESPDEIIILSDNATAFAVCAQHWCHITIS